MVWGHSFHVFGLRCTLSPSRPARPPARSRLRSRCSKYGACAQSAGPVLKARGKAPGPPSSQHARPPARQNAQSTPVLKVCGKAPGLPVSPPCPPGCLSTCQRPPPAQQSAISCVLEAQGQGFEGVLEGVLAPPTPCILAARTCAARCSKRVAKPSLSHSSPQSPTVTRSPNHWWQTSCATVSATCRSAAASASAASTSRLDSRNVTRPQFSIAPALNAGMPTRSSLGRLRV
eukprot:81569-Chlamydomonas_euryale.AAC.1